MKLSASFSTGKAAYKHDMRITLKQNINPNLSKDNIVFKDELKGQSIEDYLNKLMQPYIDEYNQKQKQECRKIKVPYLGVMFLFASVMSLLIGRIFFPDKEN